MYSCPTSLPTLVNISESLPRANCARTALLLPHQTTSVPHYSATDCSGSLRQLTLGKQLRCGGKDLTVKRQEDI